MCVCVCVIKNFITKNAQYMFKHQIPHTYIILKDLCSNVSANNKLNRGRKTLLKIVYEKSDTTFRFSRVIFPFKNLKNNISFLNKFYYFLITKGCGERLLCMETCKTRPVFNSYGYDGQNFFNNSY